MFRQTEVEGSYPNKFNHSKRGYAYPLESPYEAKNQKPAPLTHNIFTYTMSPIPNTYSPSNQHMYRNSPTRVGDYHVQAQINHPDNHNANNQKNLVDEEIFQRQKGKGAFAIDRNLTVIEKYDQSKLRSPAYYNYASPTNASQKVNLNDSLDNFKQSYQAVNSTGYQKAAENFWGIESNKTKTATQQKLADVVSNRGSVGARERPSYDPNSSFNGNNSFNGYSPNNKDNHYIRLDRTQQHPKITKDVHVSNLIQQKTLNRTWAEAQYGPTNPVSHQETINPVRHQQDKYFARPQLLGNGAHNMSHKFR